MSTPESRFATLSEALPDVLPSAAAASFVQRAGEGLFSWSELLALLEDDRPVANSLIRFAAVTSTATEPVPETLSQTLLALGLKSTLALAAAFSIQAANGSGPCHQFAYQRFWDVSLARGFAARTLGRLCSHADPDEFFVYGLLLRVGQISLAAEHPQTYAGMVAETDDPLLLLSQEQAQFRTTHLRAGLKLINGWPLPRGVATTLQVLLADSHAPSPDSSTTRDLELLRHAEGAAQVLLADQPLDTLAACLSPLMNLGLRPSDCLLLATEMRNHWKAWCRQTTSVNAFAPCTAPEVAPHEKSQGRRHPAADDDPLTILIIDDDPMTVLSLSHLLHTPTKVVINAADGSQGLALAERHQPQIVITDWRMPGLNGIELCRLLRSDERTRHTYIIMLTGCESDDELLQAFAAGADDYIVKPFKPKVLEARIRSGERLVRSHRTIIRDREIIHHYAEQLAQANRTLQELALTDVLTGLPNRRNALERLKEVTAEARRHQGPLCCIMIDIDHFKKVNDDWGHDVGDRVLRELAEVFISSARRYDMVSRIGGEEFLVICPHSTVVETQHLAERLRQAVADYPIVHDRQAIGVTISCGVAAWRQNMHDFEEMTKTADRALYRAKQRGRNCVVVEEGR
ncbi:MAG: diguanylate cyclase [Desulfofustis sp.]|jgi:diguanylate cyclase (GGDEF)-like protein|nr:diguanylate cyclase [Desulfofustis sp.]